MSLDSSSLPIGEGLTLLFQNVTDPSTGLPVYGLAKLGAVLDPSDYTSWVEVVDPRGRVGHAGSGGNQIGWRIQDDLAFKVTSGWIYETDTTAALKSLLRARDIIMPMMTSHYKIPNPDDPTQAIASVYSVLEDQGQTDMSVPIRFPNGHLYLLWTFWASIRQQYNITLVYP